MGKLKLIVLVCCLNLFLIEKALSQNTKHSQGYSNILLQLQRIKTDIKDRIKQTEKDLEKVNKEIIKIKYLLAEIQRMKVQGTPEQRQDAMKAEPIAQEALKTAEQSKKRMEKILLELKMILNFAEIQEDRLKRQGQENPNIITQVKRWISNLKNRETENTDSFLNQGDINRIIEGVIQEKVMELTEREIEDYGAEIVKDLGNTYNKEWGSKYYEKGLPIAKIAVVAKEEGAVQAGVETINYGISLIPMPTLQGEVADVGRRVYTKTVFSVLDKVLTETEKAAEILGFNFNKEEFMRNFENEMNTAQKIIYKWLKGDQ